MTEIAPPGRYMPCPAPGCGNDVDTWLAGTNVAHTTPVGVMHGDCWLSLANEEKVTLGLLEPHPEQVPLADLTPQQILDLPMEDNESGEHTVRGYLKALLRTLWLEGEGFSGKRPFGDSSWETDLYGPLATAGAIPPILDEDGYLEMTDATEKVANELISGAIEAL